MDLYFSLRNLKLALRLVHKLAFSQALQIQVSLIRHVSGSQVAYNVSVQQEGTIPL